MSRYKAVRGTNDVLPDTIKYFKKIGANAEIVAKSFNFQEIRTPNFEDSQLFTKGMGALSGVVEKELWTFHDKHGNKLALTADRSVSLARAYIEHGLFEKGKPQKLYYFAPVYLFGKDSFQDSRQAYQMGFELYNMKSPAADFEVVLAISTILEKMGIRDKCSFYLNTLGDDSCRESYSKSLKQYFKEHKDKLCSSCKRKYNNHPYWVMGCTEKSCVELCDVAPTIYGTLTKDARQHFDQLQSYFKAIDFDIQLNPRVVQDMDYYNRTLFEVHLDGEIIASGGRYDGLIENLGGKHTPVVGGALRVDTIAHYLMKNPQEDLIDAPPCFDIFLCPEGKEAINTFVPILAKLRNKDLKVEIDYSCDPETHKNTNSRLYVFLNEANAFRGYALVQNKEETISEKLPVQHLSSRLVSLLEDLGSPSSKKNKRKRGKRSSSKEESSRSSESSKKSSNKKKDRGRSSSKSSSSSSSDKNKSTKNQRSKEETSKPKERTKKRERTPRSNDVEAAPAPVIPTLDLGASKSPAPSKKSSPKKTKKSQPALDNSSPANIDWSISL